MQFDLDALVSVNTFSQKSFSRTKGFKYIYLTKINKNDLNDIFHLFPAFNSNLKTAAL